jgi:hypothetical protein
VHFLFHPHLSLLRCATVGYLAPKNSARLQGAARIAGIQYPYNPIMSMDKIYIMYSEYYYEQERTRVESRNELQKAAIAAHPQILSRQRET